MLLLFVKKDPFSKITSKNETDIKNTVGNISHTIQNVFKVR